MAQTCSIPVSIVLDIKWLRGLEKSLFTRLRWLVKMSKPCSQLNSKVIRDKVECHIVAAIEKTCSVVAFKCVWRVSDEEIQQAWNWICEKRDECDLELSKLSEVCFFFSAISTSKLDSKKKKPRTSDEGRETRRVERRICHKSFANFNAWKASFPSNFVLGGLPNSKWFSC